MPRGLPSLDIVIPLFDEEPVLPVLFERLRATFDEEATARAGLNRVRYLFVDDGSADGSASLVRDAIESGLPGVLIRLSRNFGHQAAISAGLDHADADLVAIIDADLQDPPEVILAMVARWRDGYEVVYGQRRKRKEPWPLVALYWLSSRMLALSADGPLPLDAGDFSLLDRRVVEALRALPERLRFPRGMRAWVGFRQIGVPYEREARRAGVTKYPLGKLFRLAIDGLAATSTRPLRVALPFAAFFLMLAVILGIASAARFASAGGAASSPAPWFLAGFALMSTLGAAQLFAIHALGAYVRRTYLEAKRRPAYVVMEVVQPGPRPSSETKRAFEPKLRPARQAQAQ